MSVQKVRSWMLTAAIVLTVAAASCLFIAWMAFGPGIALAKRAEVWGQRLPGGWPDSFVEPGWSTPASLNSMGLLVYEERPVEDFWVCLPGMVGMFTVGLVSLAVHSGICLLVARRASRRSRSSSLTVDLSSQSTDQERAPAQMSFRASLCRWAAIAGAAAPITVCVLRWAWAGAARGSITQRVAGGEHVEFAFGPFGRFAVLLGGAAMYLAAVLWTARILAMRNNRQPGAAQPSGRRGLVAPLLLIFLTLALLLFPYWSVQTVRLMSQGTAIRWGEWSEKTPLNSILDRLAPLP